MANIANIIENFENMIHDSKFAITEEKLKILQVNVGYLCNLSCKHCHIKAGKNRTEIMTRDTMQQILRILPKFEVLDITGGAPEMNPNFKWLVDEAFKTGIHVIVRSNLAIWTQEDYKDIPEFLSDRNVEIVCSLPYYSENDCDRQRGQGTFKAVITIVNYKKFIVVKYVLEIIVTLVRLAVVQAAEGVQYNFMKISIIVPVLNETEKISDLIRNLRELSGDKEIIISDGGSTDGTLEKLKYFNDVTVISSDSGRALQMNTGAKIATGEVLWFIHADSAVSKRSLYDIEKAIQAGALGGFFKIEFYDAKDKFMKFIEKTSHTRAKNFCLIFGDQGLFLRRDFFKELGGFAKVDLMEDWEMSSRLRKYHKQKRIYGLETIIGTSARRYIKNGRLKTWLKMNLIKTLYIIGISTKILREIYDGKR